MENKHAWEHPNVPAPELKEAPTIPAHAETGRFCPISLGDWLSLCEAAGVPAVPAHRLATINRADYFRWEEPGEHHERLQAAFRQVTQSFRPRHMLRYDCCAPSETKMRISMGEPEWRPEMTVMIFDDPRLMDIISEFPREEIPIWQRPWLNAEIVGHYPVEYRAYVKDGQIQGISNYYPQRPISFSQGHIDQVTEYTALLIQHASTPFLWNNGAFRHGFDANEDPDGIHFTADFIQPKRSNNLLFLEGGPPHELGADPCCFPAGAINGIALEPMPFSQ